MAIEVQGLGDGRYVVADNGYVVWCGYDKDKAHAVADRRIWKSSEGDAARRGEADQHLPDAIDIMARIMSTQEKYDELFLIVYELVALFGDCGTISDSEGVTRFRSLLERAIDALRDIPAPDPRPATRHAAPESARAKLPAAACTHLPEHPPCFGGWGRDGGQSDE